MRRWSQDDVLDQLLDQEGLEVDPIDRLEGDTPLHKAVRFINGLSKQEWDAGSSIVELLLDAGADPRLVNDRQTKPSGGLHGSLATDIIQDTKQS